MKKILLLFILFLFSLASCLFPSHAHADDKFTTSSTVTYNVNESGNTHVTATMVIQNTTPNYYVTSYMLKLGFTTINNLKASDNGGAIIPVVTQKDDGEEITLTFNSIVYGQNTTLPFTLSFDTPDIASKDGDIWEINIPGLHNQNDFSSFNVHVVVPPSFGKPTYIKPSLPLTSLDFTKDELHASGISLAFGNSQQYAYHLTYHLKNSNVFPIQTTIALPANTNYQKVYITSLNPRPDNVTEDMDGNWIATYIVPASQTITPIADGVIVVSLYPSESNLSTQQRADYTKPELYWQSNAPDIQKLANDLKTPQAIYQYVVGHLTYDFSRISGTQQRLGALAVLQNPTSAVCLEFTDLFVALTRAAGIPAREIDGYAYTQNTKERPLSLEKDILHAWPEYYDDNKHAWVMVDPTWGNTTGGVDYFSVLDFDHIAFVTKGEKSTSPIPAGGYKLVGQENIKDIAVTFSNEEIDRTPGVAATVVLPPRILSIFPVSGSVRFENTSNALFPMDRVSVTAGVLRPHLQTLATSDIPPFGHEDIPFSFHQTPFLTNLQDNVTISLAGKHLTKSVIVEPFTQTQAIIGGIILFAILSIIISVIAAKTRSVSIPR